MLIDVILSMMGFSLACWLGFTATRVLRNTNNKKLRAKKLAIRVIALCFICMVSYEMYDDRKNWDTQFETEVDLMDYKFDSIDRYQFYDWANSTMYEFPSPWPDEFPFTITSVGTDNSVTEIEINSYEELPISLDEVWYWYGTQATVAKEDPENAYTVFTHGQILSYTGKNAEQQVFTFVDLEGKLQNVYIVNFPYDNPCLVNTETLWFVTMWSTIVGLCIVFCMNVYCVHLTIKERKQYKNGGK